MNDLISKTQLMRAIRHSEYGDSMLYPSTIERIADSLPTYGSSEVKMPDELDDRKDSD